MSAIIQITDDNIHCAVNLWCSDMTNAERIYGHISGWDTSSVTDMVYLFEASTFNDDIRGWNTSSVANMSYMFNSNSAFNEDIGGWDVSSVTNMCWMFNNAIAFNHDIGGWDVSLVDNMERMFHGATAFNQPLGDWDVSNFTYMDYMFFKASVFNQPLGDWNMINRQKYTYDGMFRLANAFDPDNLTKKTNWSRRKNALIALNDIPIHDIFAIPEMKRNIIRWI